MRYPTGNYIVGDLVEVIKTDPLNEFASQGHSQARKYLGRKLYVMQINPFSKLSFGLSLKEPAWLDSGEQAEMRIDVHCSLAQIRHTTLEEPSTIEFKHAEPEPSSEVRRGGPTKKVRCVQTGIVYRSVIDAARGSDVSTSSVSKVLKGRSDSVYGLSWEYVND